MAKPKKPQGESLDFVANRPLLHEDLNRGEQKRMGQKYVEHNSTLVERATALRDNTKDPSQARVLDAALPHFRNQKNSPRKAASGLVDRFVQGHNFRLEGEPASPGTGWYFDHNGAIREGNGGRTDMRTATTASGSMSPLNAPENERRAATGMIRGEHDEGKTVITPDVADFLRSKSKDPSTLPDEQVGRAVKFSEMHPAVIRDMASSTRRTKFPNVDTDVDWASIARGGVNVVKGVRGLRGASNNELNPPGDAPKVNTYVANGNNFDSTDATVRHEYDFRAHNALLQEMGVVPRGQMTMDPHDLHDDTIHLDAAHMGHLTSRLRPNDPALKGLKVGQSVRMRDLHPAAVMQFADPSTRDIDVQTHRKALLSSNLPTVQDSWQNAHHADQKMVTVNGQTSVFKLAGSEGLGYWPRKSLDSGESILDKDRPNAAMVSTGALQHAMLDKINRQAAGIARDRNGLDHDVSSVLMQESPWTQMRREAGKDDAYNAATREPKVKPRGQQFEQPYLPL